MKTSASKAAGFPANKRSQKKKSKGTPVSRARKEPPRLNKSPALFVGVDIGASNLRVALADAQGTVLGKWRTSTRETSSPDMVVAQIEQGVGHLLKESSLSRKALRAVAAGAPGVTDSDRGVVVATSFLRGWRDVPFQNLLESAFRTPAAIENDVRMAALGEHWIGAARGVDDFVFLALGTGVAAGIFANGKLIRGRNSSAGEVGYMYVPGTSRQWPERGAPGALESILGGEGIRQQWQSELGRQETGADGSVPRATEIFELAGKGNAAAKRVLQRSAQLLAYAVYNISLVLDTSLFVLGGGVGRSAALLKAAQRILEPCGEPAVPKLIGSSLGEDAQLMGAIHLAMTAARPDGNREDKAFLKR